MSPLKYKDESSGRQVDVTLLGDPTSIGANVNSYETFDAKNFPAGAVKGILQHEPKLKPKDNKFQKSLISDDFTRVSVSSSHFDKINWGNTEILVQYEQQSAGKFFVPYEKKNQFCDTCFRKQQDSNKKNPIFSCGSPNCLKGRHYLCWPESLRPLKITQEIGLHYCVEHQLTAKRTKLSPQTTGIPQDNLPCFSNMSAPNDGAQIIVAKSDWIKGLNYNASKLNLVVRESTIKNSGQGLFSLSSLKKGQLVGYFFGTFISKDRHDYLVNLTNLDKKNQMQNVSFTNSAEKTFFEEFSKGVNRSLDISESLSDAEHEYYMLVSPQCPMGIINDPKGPPSTRKSASSKNNSANCEIIYPEGIKNGDWKAFQVITLCSVEANQELFFDYGYKAADWRNQIKHQSKHQSSLVTEILSSEFKTPQSKHKSVVFTPMTTPPEAISSQSAQFSRLMSTSVDKARIQESSPSTKTTIRNLAFSSPTSHFKTPQSKLKSVVFTPMTTPPEAISSQSAQFSRLMSTSVDKARIQESSPSTKTTIRSLAFSSPTSQFITPQSKLKSVGFTGSLMTTPPEAISIQSAKFSRLMSTSLDKARIRLNFSPDSIVDSSHLILKSKVFSPQKSVSPLKILSPIDENGKKKTFESAQSEPYDIDSDSNGNDINGSYGIENYQRLSDEAPLNDEDQECLEFEECGYELDAELEAYELDAELDEESDSSFESDSDSETPSISETSSAALNEISSKKKHMKVSVRTSTETKLRPHYKLTELSSHEKHQIQIFVEKFIDRTPRDFTVEEIMKKKGGSVNIDSLPHDYAEITSCCFSPERVEALRKQGVEVNDHPFKDVSKLVEIRLDILCQKKQGAQGLRSIIRSYLENRQPSVLDQGVYRRIPFYGIQICDSCFRASLGVNRNTIYTANREQKQGPARLVKPLKSLRSSHDVDTVVSNLSVLVRDEFGDTLPTNAGGEKQFIQMPFTEIKQLRNYVESYFSENKAKQTISSTTFNRALEKFELMITHNIVLSCSKNKKFMQCTPCKHLQNMSRAKSGMDSEQRFQLNKMRQNHLIQVRAQRKHYSDIRDLAK